VSSNFGPGTDDKAKIKVLVKEVKKLRGELEDTTKQLYSQQQTISSLEQALQAETTARQKAEEKLLLPSAASQTSALNDKLSLLQRDCDMFREELSRLTVENTKLKAEKTTMEDSMGIMMEQVEQLTVQLNDASALPAQLRTDKQLKEDAMFRDCFHLPGDQIVVSRHPCTYNPWMVHGVMFIAPKCVCFSVGLSKKDSKDTKENQALVLMYIDISSVEKNQRMKISFGTAKSVEFTMKDGTVHAFSAFDHRGTAMRDLCAQAKLCGAAWGEDISQKD